MKECTKCGQVRSLKDFHRKTNNKTMTSTLRSACKDCTNLENKSWVVENKDSHKQMQAEWYLKNVDKVKEDSANWRTLNREQYNKSSAAYKRKLWVESDVYRSKCAESNKQWREKNKEYCSEYKKLQIRKYRAESPAFRLQSNMSRLISLALNGKKAGKKWEELVGYTVEDLIGHLENQFDEGMSWDNYGEWHVDHIAPRKMFVLEDVNGDVDWETVGGCWDLSNLQPLWAKDNLAKGGEFNNVHRTESIS